MLEIGLKFEELYRAIKNRDLKNVEASMGTASLVWSRFDDQKQIQGLLKDFKILPPVSFK